MQWRVKMRVDASRDASRDESREASRDPSRDTMTSRERCEANKSQDLQHHPGLDHASTGMPYQRTACKATQRPNSGPLRVVTLLGYCQLLSFSSGWEGTPLRVCNGAAAARVFASLIAAWLDHWTFVLMHNTLSQYLYLVLMHKCAYIEVIPDLKLPMIRQQNHYWVALKWCTRLHLEVVPALKHPMFRHDHDLVALKWCTRLHIEVVPAGTAPADFLLLYVFCAIMHRTTTVQNKIISIFIIIINKGQQCKAGREWYTLYQSEDPSPTIPTNRQKEEKGNESRRL